MATSAAKQHLLDFLTDYQAWVDRGAPPSALFMRDSGLCSNLDRWAQNRFHFSVGESIRVESHRALMGLLRLHVRGKKGGNELYPFGGFRQYVEDTRYCTAWRNGERLQFVATTIEALRRELHG